MIKKPYLVLIYLLLVTSLVPIFSGGANQQNQQVAQPSLTRSVVDSVGTSHDLPRDLQRIAVINRQTAEALAILGLGERIIAVGDTVSRFNSYLPFANLPDLGRGAQVDIELLLTLEPDILFTHTNRQPQLEEILTPARIPVFRIDNYQPFNFDEELILLASLFDVQDRARDFLRWKNQLEQELETIIFSIPEENRPLVMALSAGFLNSQGGFRVFPSLSLNGEPGVGEGFSTILAGGRDAADLRWDPTEASTTILVENEYVFTRDPEVITLHGTWFGGYTEESVEPLHEVLSSIFENSPITQLTAGKNNRVYMFHTDMLGANKRVIGLFQLAQFLHPEIEFNFDPIALAEEYFNRWLGVPFQGIWWAASSNR